MKVQVYFKFTKKKFKKNENSKLHEEWKISPSQILGQGSNDWRGNFQRASFHNSLFLAAHIYGLM
jgi:hypothetical protein